MRVALITVGCAAACVALACVFVLAAWLGPGFDVVLLNGHEVGGRSDQIVISVVGALAGGVAIACLLRACRSR